MRSLVHSRMLDRLAPSFFVDCVTIEEDAPTRTASGAETHAWAAIDGHRNIPASVSPIAGREMRSSAMAAAETTHTIALAGSYPNVTSRMRAVVAAGPHAGIYDITAAASDSQGQATRLSVRLVVPSAGAG